MLIAVLLLTVLIISGGADISNSLKGLEGTACRMGLIFTAPLQAADCCYVRKQFLIALRSGTSLQTSPLILIHFPLASPYSASLITIAVRYCAT
jgi:hypothetical protein